MGQLLHGSATTTEAIRRAIQARQESVRAAAKRYGISPTTVQKWRSRQTRTDARMGPKESRSSVLSLEEEAVIVAFRRHTLLPLDDCLYALQPTLPHLTRSSLHRCLQRHGISRLPDVDGDKPRRSRFKAYPIGYFHIDIAQVSTEQGKLHLFVAIDRTSKFAFVQLHEKATQRIAAAFLHDLVAAVPYTIHTVLTDNGIQFTDNRPVDEEAEAKAAAYWAARDEPRIYRWHSFEWACEQTKIEHRLTKPRCPWTNGQVERMNRTIKDATVKRYHYASHDELRQHLPLFVEAYNYGRRLKTLRGLTPYEAICKAWIDEPARFTQNPHHQIPGPNIGRVGHEVVRDDHLMRGVDRDLTVVALHEAVARGQDAAVRVGEVALRPVRRPTILTAQRPALPAHA
jgi:transposase InsO family protein